MNHVNPSSLALEFRDIPNQIIKGCRWGYLELSHFRYGPRIKPKQQYQEHEHLQLIESSSSAKVKHIEKCIHQSKY